MVSWRRATKQKPKPKEKRKKTHKLLITKNETHQKQKTKNKKQKVVVGTKYIPHSVLEERRTVCIKISYNNGPRISKQSGNGMFGNIKKKKRLGVYNNFQALLTYRYVRKYNKRLGVYNNFQNDAYLPGQKKNIWYIHSRYTHTQKMRTTTKKYIHLTYKPGTTCTWYEGMKHTTTILPFVNNSDHQTSIPTSMRVLL